MAIQPVISVLDQQLLVVWSDNRLGNHELFLRHSTDAGHTWQPEQRLTETVADSVEPAMVSDPLSLHLVWVERSLSARTLWYQRYSQGEWSPPVPLSAGPARVAEPKIAVTSSYPQFSVYVVWEAHTDSEVTAMIRASRDGGKTWEPERRITEGNWETREPQVAAGPKVAYIVWRDSRESDGQVFFKRWGDYQLSPDVRIYPEGGCRRPVISVVGEQIAIAWERRDSSAAVGNILSIHSPDGSRTWSEVQSVTESSAEAIRPAIQIVSGDAWLFWQDGRDGQWAIYTASRRLREREWSPGIRFAEAVSDAFRPELATSMGNPEDQLHAVWFTLETDENGGIHYRRRDTIPPMPPQQPEHIDLGAIDGYDDDGQLTFMWPHTFDAIPVSYRVYVSRDEGPFELWNPGQTVTHPPVDLTGVQGSEYRIAVEAVDAVGNASERSEPSAAVLVDQVQPFTQILTPLANTVLMENTTVTINCTDERLHSWQLMFGPTENPETWIRLTDPGRAPVEDFAAASWDLRALTGIYTLRLVAQDLAGNVNEARIQIAVDNEPPLPLVAAGQELILANTTDAFFGQPSWSRQDQLSYVSNVGGATDIWRLDLQSRVQVRMTQDTHVDAFPDWSPNGQYVVSESLRNDRWQIWVRRGDGSEARPLLADGLMNRHPTWSPNGQQLAFASDRDGDYEIWLLANAADALNGATPVVMKVTDNQWDDQHPSWSPNGTELVFQSYRSNNWDLFQIQIDGVLEQRLTVEPSNETQPEWAPDGKQVLFLSDRARNPQTGVGGSYLLNIQTGTVTLVTTNVLSADWSPGLDAIVQESPEGISLLNVTSPIQSLEARLDRPFHGEYVQGGIEILGIARGTEFSHYELQFREVGAEWQTLGGTSTAPVLKSGFLGTLDATKLEGHYQIRLQVTGSNGQVQEDELSVLVGQEAPALFLQTPAEGLRTLEPRILVSGQTDPRAKVWVNQETVLLAESGDGLLSFSVWIALQPGENTIQVRSSDPFGVETEVARHVFLDQTPPRIQIEMPSDFESVLAPYTTVRGTVNIKAQVSVDSDRVSFPSSHVPLQDGNRFEREALLLPGTNTLVIRALDELGRITEVTRRVLYETKAVILEDVTPPAVVNAFPMDGQTLSSGQVEFLATLVDDVALDLDSIRFEFDGEEVDEEDYELSADTGLLKYLVPEELVDGSYTFRIHVADKTGHTTVADISFRIDSVPLYAGLSATIEPEGVRVIVASNQPLLSNPGVDLVLEPGPRAYSLTLSPTGGTPQQYVNTFDLAPSQQAFRLLSQVLTQSGEPLSLEGYLTFGTLLPGHTLPLPPLTTIQAVQPEFQVTVSDPQNALSVPYVVNLRSQMPLDMDRLAAQALDAASRNLETHSIVYEIETDPVFPDDQVFPLALELRAHAPTELPLALFHWNAQLQRWTPLADQRRLDAMFYQAQVSSLGGYALLRDETAPIVERISPGDREEVPLDRFLIEAYVHDDGAGVATIQLRVDDQIAPYEYNPETGQFIYLPSELGPGLHTLQFEVMDRAQNTTHVESIFFTQDVFAFADSVIAYPNPAQEQVTIRFKVTRLATVTLRIYTVSGMLIYTETLANVAGRSDLREYFTWELENQRGETVAPGIYVYQLEATRDEQTIRQEGKIAVTR